MISNTTMLHWGARCGIRWPVRLGCQNLSATMTLASYFGDPQSGRSVTKPRRAQLKM
jgi:hypothetical protein